MNNLKNLEATKEAVSALKLLTKFAETAFNRHVEGVYYSNSEEHKLAKKALLITEKDTQLSIVNKQLLFFFSLQKFTQQTEERISFAKGTAPTDPEMIRIKVQLSPSLLYGKDGQPIGKRYISVPHVDESQLSNFKDFTFTHGSVTRLYCFADKKQIKVEAIDQNEGDKAINALLKLVQKEWKLGSSEEHSYTGRPPKDTTKPLLEGLTSKCNQLHIYYPNQKRTVFYV